MLWYCLSLILSVLNWTLRPQHQWNSVLISKSIYYVHMMVVCSWKTIENYLMKILENWVSRVSTDWEFPSIDRMFLFDRSNVPFRSIEQKSRINRVNPRVCTKFIKILSHREFLSINRICLLDRSNRNQELIESSKLFIKIFFMISINQGAHSIDRKLWVLNFH